LGQYIKCRNGRILIGNPQGFYSFFPEELDIKTPPFEINITDFFINNLPVIPGKETPLQKPVEEISALVLKYSQNNFGFNFAGVDYRAPEANKYFTKLENYDKTWREASAEKSAYYFYVSPGTYVFRVRATNSDGTEGEKVITIRIDPPWWKTWWAYSIYGLLLIAAIFAVYRIQKQRIIRTERQKSQMKELAREKEIEKQRLEHKLELQRFESEKTKVELQQRATELEMQALRAQMNPHFIFNILNTIEAYALENNKEAVSGIIQKFSRLTRLILENSRNQLVPFENDWKSLQLYIELEQMRYADKFLVAYNVQEQILEQDYFIPPMIIQPFVENAIIHGLKNKADHCGILNLSANLQNGYIIVQVEDNGIGRAKAAELKDNNPIHKNSLGIKVTQDRISTFNNLNQERKANVEIQDLHEGTRVVIWLPATN